MTLADVELPTMTSTGAAKLEAINAANSSATMLTHCPVDEHSANPSMQQPCMLSNPMKCAGMLSTNSDLDKFKRQL